MNEPADDQEPPTRRPGRKKSWTKRAWQTIAIAINLARLVLEFLRYHDALTRWFW